MTEQEKELLASDEAILDEAGGLRWVNAPACPVCGGAERRPFDRFVIDTEHGYVRCRRCDVLYLDPRPVYDEDFIERMYGFAGRMETRPRRPARHSRDLERLIEIERFVPGKGTLLDIGCNTGSLLLAARARGWRVAGVDISDARVELCRSRGLEDVTCEDITAAARVERPFDVVSACHVLEHAPDPVAFLSAVRDRVRDAGLVLIEMPNVMALDLRVKGWFERRGLKRHRMGNPRHLLGFTHKAFGYLAEKVGLRIIACRTYSHEACRPGILARAGREFMKRFLVGGKFRFFLRR